MLPSLDSIIITFGFFLVIDKPLFITRNQGWYAQRIRSRSARTTIAPLGYASSSTDDNDDSAIGRRRHSLIESMAKFYVDMVDPNSHRFYSTCVPSTGVRCHESNPMRDLAAAWDASKLLLYHRRSRDERCGEEEESNHDNILQRAISTTVEHYQRGLIAVTTPTTTSGSTDQTSSGLQLSSSHLQEPSHIGHSAMMILAIIGSFQVSSLSSLSASLPQQSSPPPPPDYSYRNIIAALAWGILSMQRDDGAFCLSFGKGQQDDNVYTGIEFYPGEAMVALAEVYHLVWAFPGPATAFTTLNNAILVALRRAFRFYSDYYFHQGTAKDANYSIWQIQAFTRLLRLLRSRQPKTVGSISTNNDNDDDDLLQSIGSFVVALAETVLGSNAWKYQLARGPSFYANLNTIEIACGLDALGDIAMLDMAELTTKSESLVQIGPQRVGEAVRFFEWTLSKVPPEAVRGTGGLGFGGTVVREQRLDVTGHALSALIKLQSSSNTER
jgi:hypothetical protein